MKKLNSNLQALYTDLQQIVAPGSLLCNEPLAAHTTFKIGGPADIFVTPQTMSQLSQVMAAIHQARCTAHRFGERLQCLGARWRYSRSRVVTQ